MNSLKKHPLKRLYLMYSQAHLSYQKLDNN